MKPCLPALLPLLSAGCTSVTAAPDISGIWTLKMDRDFRGDADMSVDCTVQQRQNALTVRCGRGVEMDGEGRGVSWSHEEMVRVPPMTTEDRLVLVCVRNVYVYLPTVPARGRRSRGERVSDVRSILDDEESRDGAEAESAEALLHAPVGLSTRR